MKGAQVTGHRELFVARRTVSFGVSCASRHGTAAREPFLNEKQAVPTTPVRQAQSMIVDRGPRCFSPAPVTQPD